MLWARALSLKEIWHGNSTVPEVRVLTFCSRVQNFFFFFCLTKLSVIILDKIKTLPEWQRSFSKESDPKYNLIFGK